MEDCRTVTTPCETNKLTSATIGEELADKRECQAVIGSLMYLAQATKPDLAYSVGLLSRYSSNPTMKHWGAVKRVLRYLSGSINLGLNIRRQSGDIKIVG